MARALSCVSKTCEKRRARRRKRRKKAEATTHKLKARLSKGEKRNRKRMATVASVYEVAPHVRTAGQIMGQDESSTPKRPKVRNKRVWASLRQTPAEVIEEMFAEAERRDPKQERTWLVLVDGQEAQQREVEAAIARHRADVVVIQDFVHVLEYLCKAAYCFHAEGTQEAETWVLERAYALLQGKVSEVAAGMRRSATRQGLSQEAAKASHKRRGHRSTSVPTTCSRTRNVSTMPPHWPTAGRSPPASSRALVVTWSRTAWTSPAPAGVWTVRKGYSACAPFVPAVTSKSTWPFTIAKSAGATTCPHRRTMTSNWLRDRRKTVAQKSRTQMT